MRGVGGGGQAACPVLTIFVALMLHGPAWLTGYLASPAQKQSHRTSMLAFPLILLWSMPPPPWLASKQGSVLALYPWLPG